MAVWFLSVSWCLWHLKKRTRFSRNSSRLSYLVAIFHLSQSYQNEQQPKIFTNANLNTWVIHLTQSPYIYIKWCAYILWNWQHKKQIERDTSFLADTNTQTLMKPRNRVHTNAHNNKPPYLARIKHRPKEREKSCLFQNFVHNYFVRHFGRAANKPKRKRKKKKIDEENLLRSKSDTSYYIWYMSITPFWKLKKEIKMAIFVPFFICKQLFSDIHIWIGNVDNALWLVI